jgi:4-hydroxybenzoyl-CoA thioesterase
MSEIRIQTYWADCDPAGIVFYGNFFRLFEQVEEELFLRASRYRQNLLDKYEIWMPRVEAHANYVRPIRNGRAIRVRVNPEFKGEKTVRLDFTVVDDETGAELANGYVTVVCVDRAHFKAAPIPDEIRQVLSGTLQQA